MESLPIPDWKMSAVGIWSMKNVFLRVIGPASRLYFSQSLAESHLNPLLLRPGPSSAGLDPVSVHGPTPGTWLSP